MIMGFVLFLTLLVGMSLGVLGGGGSILLVPLLHGILGWPMVQATLGSLAVVGVTSAVGAALAFRKGHLSLRACALFAPASLLGVLVMRSLVLPRLPSQWMWGGVVVSLGQVVLVSFVIMMVAAALAMWRSAKNRGAVVFNDAQKKSGDFVTLSSDVVAKGRMVKLILFSFFVGIVTAFIGAGGGFLIVPALVSVFLLPMPVAAGTSLAIIALNGLLGWILGMRSGVTLPLLHLTAIVILSLVGLRWGLILAPRFSQSTLKKIFSLLALFVAAAMIAKEFL